ncbi:MAG: hypothetical protein MO853_08205 [Candidatus Protistobacter heckmanni]|nr:hypothetical protein [Candidatus Protistobacter heckmanni]
MNLDTLASLLRFLLQDPFCRVVTVVALSLPVYASVYVLLQDVFACTASCASGSSGAFARRHSVWAIIPRIGTQEAVRGPAGYA